MKVLGIETSCDETAAAVVEDGYRLLSNAVASSLNLHIAYGGVVPEIAARSHLEVILPTIDEALLAARCSWGDIDAIAVTAGPGLVGSLLIGALTASTLSAVKNKPLYAINHVEAHVYANFLTQSTQESYEFPPSPPRFPVLALIVSGGHTQLVLFMDHFNYRLLGQTTDDAVGEAFDKVAKMLGLPYPGGPSIALAANKGNPDYVKLPKAQMSSPYDFSFSGLKTAALRTSQQMAGKDFTLPSSALPKLLSDSQKADIAASFQKVAVEALVDALALADKEFNPESVVIAGGVAANQQLRDEATKRLGKNIFYPDIKLCTDNAAMVAVNGYFQMTLKKPPTDPFSLDVEPGLTM